MEGGILEQTRFQYSYPLPLARRWVTHALREQYPTTRGVEPGSSIVPDFSSALSIVLPPLSLISVRLFLSHPLTACVLLASLFAPLPPLPGVSHPCLLFPTVGHSHFTHCITMNGTTT
jgi:hypothetical protein